MNNPHSRDLSTDLSTATDTLLREAYQFIPLSCLPPGDNCDSRDWWGRDFRRRRCQGIACLSLEGTMWLAIASFLAESVDWADSGSRVGGAGEENRAERAQARKRASH